MEEKKQQESTNGEIGGKQVAGETSESMLHDLLRVTRAFQGSNEKVTTNEGEGQIIQ